MKITSIKLKPIITKCWAICQLDQTGNAIFFSLKKPLDMNKWIINEERDDLISMYIEDFNLLYGQNISTIYKELEQKFGLADCDDNFTYNPFQIELPLFLDENNRHIFFGQNAI